MHSKAQAQDRSGHRPHPAAKTHEERELDQLDSAVARIEGHTEHPNRPAAGSPARTPYQPTRDPGEALRLMDKYIARAVKVNRGWVAIGRNGRACSGATLAIAVCKAIIEAQGG